MTLMSRSGVGLIDSNSITAIPIAMTRGTARNKTDSVPSNTAVASTTSSVNIRYSTNPKLA